MISSTFLLKIIIWKTFAIKEIESEITKLGNQYPKLILSDNVNTIFTSDISSSNLIIQFLVFNSNYIQDSLYKYMHSIAVKIVDDQSMIDLNNYLKESTAYFENTIQLFIHAVAQDQAKERNHKINK